VYKLNAILVDSASTLWLGYIICNSPLTCTKKMFNRL